MYMSDQGVFLSKWPHNWRIILAKEQLGYSYIFWTMPILIFCQFANFGNQSLNKEGQPLPTKLPIVKRFINMQINLAKLCYYAQKSSENFPNMAGFIKFFIYRRKIATDIRHTKLSWSIFEHFYGYRIHPEGPFSSFCWDWHLEYWGIYCISRIFKYFYAIRICQ